MSLPDRLAVSTRIVKPAASVAPRFGDACETT
jgi:hypothetical protein